MESNWKPLVKCVEVSWYVSLACTNSFALPPESNVGGADRDRSVESANGSDTIHKEEASVTSCSYLEEEWNDRSKVPVGGCLHCLASDASHL